jgi:hypothetical protein
MNSPVKTSAIGSDDRMKTIADFKKDLYKNHVSLGREGEHSMQGNVPMSKTRYDQETGEGDEVVEGKTTKELVSALKKENFTIRHPN